MNVSYVEGGCVKVESQKNIKKGVCLFEGGCNYDFKKKSKQGKLLHFLMHLSP